MVIEWIKKSVSGLYPGREIIFFSLLILISSKVDAQIGFNSEKLKQVFGMLPETYKKSIEEKSKSKPGSYLLEVNLNGLDKKLVYRINNYKEIDHLGLYLINDSQNDSSLRDIFDYLERAFLVSALRKEKYPLVKEVDNNIIEVLYNGKQLKNQKNPLLILPKTQINKDTPFRIKYDANFFVIDWLIESSNKLEIKVPNNYFLITEKTKDELELDLMRKLKISRKPGLSHERPSRNQLTLFKGNVYLSKGESYHNTIELSSNKYFIINDSVFPVFNGKFYKESIRNLFLNLIPTPINLHITQKLYGGKQEEFTININSFYRNFSSDYNLYFGWQIEDKDNLKASIFLINKVFNYNHLLEITTNSKVVFRKSGEVDGLFFAYIPKENNKDMHILK